mmetsp:Transcript_26798/g.43396  ORF Transcript_26798/g.43396 Transcript_26798/m.43396 type:complete len:259 (+) Transcript_26798:48-824(+)
MGAFRTLDAFSLPMRESSAQFFCFVIAIASSSSFASSVQGSDFGVKPMKDADGDLVDLLFLSSRYDLMGVPRISPRLEVDFGYDYGPLWTGSKCEDTEFNLDETYHPPAIRCRGCDKDHNYSIVLIGLDDPGKDPLGPGRKGWGKSPLLHWAISNLNGTRLQKLREYEEIKDDGLEVAEYRHPYPKYGCQRYSLIATQEPMGWTPPAYEAGDEMPRRNWPLQAWIDVHNRRVVVCYRAVVIMLWVDTIHLYFILTYIE